MSILNKICFKPVEGNPLPGTSGKQLLKRVCLMLSMIMIVNVNVEKRFYRVQSYNMRPTVNSQQYAGLKVMH